MENKLHNIDELFAKTLGDHSMDPPAYVWDNIKSKMDAASGKRRARIGWIAGTASAVILSFIGGYFIANSAESNYTPATSEKITNTHSIDIDINRFWNLRTVVIGETSVAGGHTFTYTVPGETTETSKVHTTGTYTPTNTTGDEYVNKNSANSQPGYFGTQTSKDIRNKNTKPANVVNPVRSANIAEEDDGKKTEAATSDVKNAPGIEPEANDIGFTSVAALESSHVIENVHIVPETPVQDEPIQISESQPVSNDNQNQINHEGQEVSQPARQDQQKDLVADNYQDEKGEPNMVKDENPTSFTILSYFAPTYTVRNSAMRNTTGTQNAFGTNQDFVEAANFSYSAGLLVGYNFTPRLTVFIGASFNSFSNTTSRDFLHTRSFDQLSPADSSTPVITTAGELGQMNVVPTSTGSPEDPTYMIQDNEIGTIRRVTQSFSYIEVPVLARYRFLGPKFGIIVTGGISTGFIVQNQAIAEGDNGKKIYGGTDHIRNFNMNATIGVGIEARLLPFMYLNIEPTFKYSFLNWSMDNRFQMNPFSFGLNTGLAFKI